MNDKHRRLVTRVKRACKLQPDRRAFQRWTLCGVLLGQLVWIGAAPLSAEETQARPNTQQGLDEQVQEIKSGVLGIAAELDRLEERLLYPSNTQVAVFVALGEGESFRLDSVEIQLDGEVVARHIYSFKELEALQKGGVQRIYTGNVATGGHRLAVSVAGKLPNGDDLTASETFGFDKEVEPKLVGITLADGDSGEPRVRLGGW